MAQGSFASRIFHKYCKNSQEQRGQESETPRISEFTIMWDKLSKCTILPLLLKYVDRPPLLWAGGVSACHHHSVGLFQERKKKAYLIGFGCC